MKNNSFFYKIFSFIGVIAVLPLLAGCDDISADDRYVEIEAAVPARVVLIEDFTGQNCVNCPDAHSAIEELRKQYGDAIVPVSIHGGEFAIGRERTDFDSGYIGLATPEGAYYNTLFNLSSWPQGLIDRRGGTIDYGSWAAAVRSEIERPAELSIDLSAHLSPDGSAIDIDLELIPQSDIEGWLHVWVIEDGIIARQRSSSGLIAGYVHDNVFRAAVNGTDGEKVKLSRGIHFDADYQIGIRYNNEERWNAENLSVVAFVRDDKGVCQTALFRL